MWNKIKKKEKKKGLPDDICKFLIHIENDQYFVDYWQLLLRNNRLSTYAWQ